MPLTCPPDGYQGWQWEFEDPIPLPDGRTLVTLRDAGNYITTRPKAVHTAPAWQAAMEALILVMKIGGPMMFARIGFMQALNRDLVRVFNLDRKSTHWGKRKLKRHQYAANRAAKWG
jgi:hypothetical protein